MWRPPLTADEVERIEGLLRQKITHRVIAEQIGYSQNVVDEIAMGRHTIQLRRKSAKLCPCGCKNCGYCVAYRARLWRIMHGLPL
jgi:hypothetical protein